MNSNNNSINRFPLPDQLRALAIILMIIFHSFYDATMFGWLKIDFQKELFWWVFPRIIVFLFLLAVGLSLFLTKDMANFWKKFTIRFFKLAFFAGIISAVTYKLFPDRWVYSGTLHCIASVSLMSLAFLWNRWVALTTALFFIIPTIFNLFEWWWPVLSHRSMDYIPAIPWVGVTALGVFLGYFRLHEKSLFPQSFSRLQRFFAFLGKHSLLIYLMHQPLIFGTFSLLNLIFKKAS